MDTYEDLNFYLRDTLYLCSCKSLNALTILFFILSLAKDIPNSPNKLRSLNYFPAGWGERFIYMLESKKLIWHGSSIFDFAIEEKGKILLQGLTKFYKKLDIDKDILNDLADTYMQLGESHIALRKINVFLEYFPGNEMGLYTKAEILFELEQYDQSLQSINQSLNIEACAEKEDFKNKIIDRVKKN